MITWGQKVRDVMATKNIAGTQFWYGKNYHIRYFADPISSHYELTVLPVADIGGRQLLWLRSWKGIASPKVIVNSRYWTQLTIFVTIKPTYRLKHKTAWLNSRDRENAIGSPILPCSLASVRFRSSFSCQNSLTLQFVLKSVTDEKSPEKSKDAIEMQEVRNKIIL